MGLSLELVLLGSRSSSLGSSIGFGGSGERTDTGFNTQSSTILANDIQAIRHGAGWNIRTYAKKLIDCFHGLGAIGIVGFEVDLPKTAAIFL